MDEVIRGSGYHVFLLRLWSDSASGSRASGVRFSLENPMTRNRRGFESVEDLACYLATLAGGPDGSAGRACNGEPPPQGPARKEVEP